MNILKVLTMKIPPVSTTENSPEQMTDQVSNHITEMKIDNDPKSSSNKNEIIQKIKTSLFKEERNRLWKVVKQIRQSSKLDDFINNTATVIQKELTADRVAIYRFEGETNGRVIAEALVSGWTPSLNEIVPADCFGGQKAADYKSQGLVAIENINNSKLTPHQKQLLERFQVKASLALPIMLDPLSSEDNAYGLNQVWGLLVVQQCSQARQWQEDEINLLYQLTLELTRVLQPPLPRLQSGTQEDFLTVINQEMQQLMQTMLQEIRLSMKADRVWVYGFNPDGSGEVLAESVASQWQKAAANSFDDDCFLTAKNCQSQYVVNDIYAKGLPSCLVERLEAQQAKAYIAIPIMSGEDLLGILAVFQNSGPRNWQQSEVNLMLKFAKKFSFPLEQNAFMRNTQFQAKQMAKDNQQEKAINNIVQRISSSQKLQGIFRSATQEVRKVLEVDRAVVYRFNPDWTGEVLAESAGSEWVSVMELQETDKTLYSKEMNADEQCTLKYMEAGSALDQDTYFINTQGGDYTRGKKFNVVNDIYTAGFSSCYLQSLEKYQARAYIIVPIFQNMKIWGLFAVYQNSGTRKWQPNELNLLLKIAPQLGIAIEQAEKIKELEIQAKQEKAIANIVQRISSAQKLKDIFRTATKEVRKALEVDRAVVYRFNPDWTGEVLAESAGSEWISVMEIQETDEALFSQEMNADEQCTLKNMKASSALDQDTYFINTEGGDYTRGKKFNVVNDIYTAGFSSCYLQSLEKYQARAYIIVPIFQNMKIWGLFAVYQNSGSREWQSNELNLMLKIVPQLGIAIEQAEKSEQLSKTVFKQRSLAQLVDRMRVASSLEHVLEIAAQETRKLLEVERTSIYRFNADWSGENVVEAPVDQDFKALQASCFQTTYAQNPYPYLQKNQGGSYKNGESSIVNDLSESDLEERLVAILERLDVKAYIKMPIFVEDRLWGIINIYQSRTRVWQEEDIEFLKRIVVQIGIVIQQKQNLEELQIKAQQEQAINRIGEKIRQSLDIKHIFQSTTQELRQALQCDRSVIYQFNEDWTGQVVAESVASGWVSLLIEQTNDEVLSGDRTGSDRCILRNWSAGDIVEPDSFLRETQGGRYARGQKFTAVNDIYTQGFPTCYVQSLEKYQAKAYLIAPIFMGEKLWGLLGIYQNEGPRVWQNSESDLIMQIANQLAVALQQTKLIEQIRTRSEELAQNNERENAIIQFSGQLINRLAGLAQENTDTAPILKFATAELRQVLQASRVGVYRFLPNWMGEFIVESTDNNSPKLVGTELAQIQDTYLKENQGGRYVNRESLRVDDIDQSHSNEGMISLEQWGTKSYMIAPIFKGEQLWGLLGVYQNDRIRHWSTSEQAIMDQVATQIGVTLQLSEYLAQTRSQEEKLSEIAEQERAKREQLQQGALRVLRALEPSFRGDLTVRAPLSEDEIGTIADGYNTTIQSLRELVRQVQISASRVSDTSDSNTISVHQLSTQSQEQVNQLQEALEELEVMVVLSDAVKDNAQRVEQAVQEANNKVQTGDSLMEKTVDSILEIRDTVSETAKKVKRLGEASQKISKVVNLIDNFATQTNLLSLNAAIEATRAGEYGKGFAVVADEVRVLAYQSANATTEIERLIEEIQKEVSEVTEVMEIGIAQVVQGSNLVDETRNSLSEIVTVTSDISKLVQGITKASTTQSQQSQTLTQVMTDVSTLANKTVDNSNLISQSFQELLETSQELQTSVSQFKVD